MSSATVLASMFSMAFLAYSGYAAACDEASETCSQAIELSAAMPQTGQSALLQIRHTFLGNESLHKKRSIYNPSGAAAPLTEEGYASVADCCCQNEMLEFARRATVDLNLEVCDQGGLIGITPFHTCEKGPLNYDTLVGDLLRDSAKRCTWIAPLGSCKERPSDCPGSEEEGSPFVDCGCSVSKAIKPDFPRATIGQDNLGGSGPDTGAEELRLVNVFGAAQPIRWTKDPHWCIDVSGGDATNGNDVYLWRCLAEGTWFNQQWTLPASGAGQVRWTPHPDKCLDVANTNKGTQLRIWDCSADNPNMQWSVPTDGSGRLFLTDTPSKCVDNSGGSIGPGNKVQIWDCSESGENAIWTTPIPTDATDLVITSLNAYVPPTSVAAVLLNSGHCAADMQYSKAECLAAAIATGADSSKTSLDGGADGGLNGRPQGCTRHQTGGGVEWWGASDNAVCGSLGFTCVCKQVTSWNTALQTDMANGFGSLALRRGTSTDFQFKFVVSGSSLPVVLEELHMAFSNLDKTLDGIVKLTSGSCPADNQFTKAGCLDAAKAVGADTNKTALDGGADGGLNGRPAGCTMNGGSVEWWGASDNAACGSLGFACVCKDLAYQEFVSSTNYKGYLVDGSTSLTASRTSDKRTQFSGSVSVPSPTSSTSMTDAQMKASVMFYYKNVSEFVVTFGSGIGTFDESSKASLMFSSDTTLETRCET